MVNRYYKADINRITPTHRVFREIFVGGLNDHDFTEKELSSGYQQVFPSDFLNYKKLVERLEVDPNSFYEKSLNRDDIEELGWAYKGNHWFYKGDEYYEFNIDEDSSYFLHAHHYLSEGPVRYSIINGSPTHLYGLSDSSYVFDGEIRNYNELKFIMERVDIKKEQNESKE